MKTHLDCEPTDNGYRDPHVELTRWCRLCLIIDLIVLDTPLKYNVNSKLYLEVRYNFLVLVCIFVYKNCLRDRNSSNIQLTLFSVYSHLYSFTYWLYFYDWGTMDHNNFYLIRPLWDNIKSLLKERNQRFVIEVLGKNLTIR